MKSIHLLTLAFAAFPFSALADAPASSAPGGVDVQEVSQLHDEISILEQKLQIDQLQAKLRAAGGGDDPAPASSNESSPSAQTGASASNALPEVVSIESAPGNGRRLTAMLQLANGMQISAYPGLGLPGGLTVYDITYDGVRVMDAGQLEVLPNVTDTTSTPNAMPMPGAQPVMPMMIGAP
jgi:type IV pilus biogenesis protein PilP